MNENSKGILGKVAADDLKPVLADLTRIQVSIREAQSLQSERMKELGHKRELLVEEWFRSGPHKASQEAAYREQLKSIGATVHRIGQWHSSSTDDLTLLMQTANEVRDKTLEVRLEVLQLVRDKYQNMLEVGIAELCRLTEDLATKVDRLAKFSS